MEFFRSDSLKNLFSNLGDTFFSKDLSQSLIEFLFHLILFVFLWYTGIKLATKFLRVLSKLVKKTQTKIDDYLLNKSTLRWAPHLAISFVLFAISNYLNLSLVAQNFFLTFFYIYLIISLLNTVNALIDGGFYVYQNLELPDNFNLKGIKQSFKIVVYIFAVVLIVAKLVGVSPWQLLSGLGALTAILILIFRDPIMGLVAGIQLFANKMVKLGDWIEIPENHVDGMIIDISLTTIQVQNWDKTIVNLPTHALVSKSFKNWRGIQEVGGRRIKRHLLIDTNSIRFVTDKEITKYKKNPILKTYFESIVEEEKKIDKNSPISQFKKKKPLLTNLGIFREYIYHYLRHHRKLNQNLTLMVYQLNPTSKGLPLQVYTFSKSTQWDIYENIQSEIFEHLFAVANEFSIKTFQDPSGEDFRKTFTK